MLSIVTPHYNNIEGLKRIYSCLKKQSSDAWEWLVIDDFSDVTIRNMVKDFFQSISDHQVQLMVNTIKTNASVCRNIGIERSSYENVVFLDSDDYITEDFVANRSVQVEEFVVFKNYKIINEDGDVFTKCPDVSNPIDSFLSANFIWQTTCVLWNKTFLTQIGNYDPNLNRLQDVELSIRALLLGLDNKIIDNKIDFLYCTKPIRLKPRIVMESCSSVNYLIEKINTNYSLDAQRNSLIKAYYYACVKGLHRSGVRTDVVYVKESIRLFFKKRYINLFELFIGTTLLTLYKYHLISDALFLNVNRYFFK